MAHGSTPPFKPSGMLTLTGNSTTSTNGTLVGSGATCLIVNAGSAGAFIAFGSDLTVTANNAGPIFLLHGSMMVDIGERTATAAVLFTGTGSGPVYFMRGDGANY